VDLLADSSKFPEEWLFNHRWGKGKKDSAATLPNGAKITFLTVGGRTSCVIPSVQKKTGAVAGDVKEVEDGDEKPTGKKSATSNGTKKRKDAPKVEESDSEEQTGEASKKLKGAKESKPATSKTTTNPTKKSDRTASRPLVKSAKVKEEAVESRQRRSGRGKSKV
jgi:formamidopyrimidine-DNA glycosylase